MRYLVSKDFEGEILKKAAEILEADEEGDISEFDALVEVLEKSIIKHFHYRTSYILRRVQSLEKQLRGA